MRLTYWYVLLQAHKRLKKIFIVLHKELKVTVPPIIWLCCSILYIIFILYLHICPSFCSIWNKWSMTLLLRIAKIDNRNSSPVLPLFMLTEVCSDICDYGRPFNIMVRFLFLFFPKRLIEMMNYFLNVFGKKSISINYSYIYVCVWERIFF